MAISGGRLPGSACVLFSIVPDHRLFPNDSRGTLVLGSLLIRLCFLPCFCIGVWRVFVLR